jgi:uridine phosphorylase
MENIDQERQYHIGLRRGDVGKYVLLPGDPERVPMIASFFDEAKEVAFNREYRTITGTVDGIRISATSTGIGCPSAAIAVEELIRVGAEVFIRVGTAGSLQRGVEVGDVCITTAAVREEGTTRQYVPLSYPAVADIDVTLALRKAAMRLGIRNHVGISHCKDAFFIEPEKGAEPLPLEEQNQTLWKTWERANVLSTSMESAAIFVISSIRGVKAGEVVAILGLTYEDVPIVAQVGVEDAAKVALTAVQIMEKEGPEI